MYLYHLCKVAIMQFMLSVMFSPFGTVIPILFRFVSLGVYLDWISQSIGRVPLALEFPCVLVY